MEASDLISRADAVREALRLYRDARENARDFREAEDDFATLAFESQMEAFRWMVMVLMALPAAGKDEADKEQNEPLTIEQLREMDGELILHHVELNRAMEAAQNAYLKNRTLENADRLSAVLDGRLTECSPAGPVQNT